MKNFYFDVELHEVPMRQAKVDIIGPDRILYGSNFGGGDVVRHDLTDGLRLSPMELDKIRWKNACELLHLDPAKIGSVTPLVKAA
ncbi:hypothetical protein RGU75_22485 [Glaciimonas sp. CA11.2]|nr:hypothetical protein [Glaciimonas sp. CA11.2]MDY7548985.1 hypothetical protein [Glaciimonas sp. CA11.2]